MPSQLEQGRERFQARPFDKTVGLFPCPRVAPDQSLDMPLDLRID
jgi:hypothetical protein